MQIVQNLIQEILLIPGRIFHREDVPIKEISPEHSSNFKGRGICSLPDNIEGNYLRQLAADLESGLA
jgi:hypothetical protein